MNTLRKISHLLAGGAALIFLSGCAETGQSGQGFWGDVTSIKEDLKIWKKTKGYKGIQYHATDKVVPTFQEREVPVNCRVFAHLLVYIPGGSTGKALAETVEAEAMRRGADMLLIGGTRQAKDDQGPEF
ncbi:MAG: hypothetical protein D3910_17530, partial [Candidatus Electrothrix sp. ATG2]|nr:hypothetical protein [Candidatus Electrothrix sp. ATG2]